MPYPLATGLDVVEVGGADADLVGKLCGFEPPRLSEESEGCADPHPVAFLERNPLCSAITASPS